MIKNIKNLWFFSLSLPFSCFLFTSSCLLQTFSICFLLLSFLFLHFYFPSSLTNYFDVIWVPFYTAHNALHSPMISHLSFPLDSLLVITCQQASFDHTHSSNTSVSTFLTKNIYLTSKKMNNLVNLRCHRVKMSTPQLSTCYHKSIFLSRQWLKVTRIKDIKHFQYSFIFR